MPVAVGGRRGDGVTPDIRTGDCLAVMRDMPAASVDAIVTDPPYGLKFMGKLWDHGVPGEEFWAEALRVAKPGGHLLAFGGTRTFHRLACAVEDGGWRIYDCLAWMYGQGFPKHRTHLKPAWEPVVFASKKGERFVNVEACRLEWVGPEDAAAAAAAAAGGFAESRARGTTRQSPAIGKESRDGENRYDPTALKGRWPANVLLDEEAARMVDEQGGERTSGTLKPSRRQPLGFYANGISRRIEGWRRDCPGFPGSSGGASRFFFTSKATRADRDEGLSGCDERHLGNGKNWTDRDTRTHDRSRQTNRTAANFHPTVKPTDLMRWLCRLVTPAGGLILDPFAGSGSTGVAALSEGFRFVGIEIDPDYVEIARRRCAAVAPLFAEEASS